MKERPILFSAPMVRAILDGRKTQTRRLLQKRHETDDAHDYTGKGATWFFTQSPFTKRDKAAVVKCSYGKPGDRLWVRETFVPTVNGPLYRADSLADSFKGWKPSIHMPRVFSRITLTITGIGVERLQDISEDDARAEGYLAEGDSLDHDGHSCYDGQCRDWYQVLWENINGPDSWDQNPWVWVVKFKALPLGHHQA